ncbi:MAG: hypothetical protein QF858_03730 [Candidatus Pacebacteria bacterium]|jgi:uncharacterized membrane protein YczE|nr:hypothetical protein [bacterium]MDP6527954.1 hypothetical protein [Candidatus Paceibacterota bacterium]MDP6659483.1 hypothetical protein [Candidatus Paceibacterota bacterium]|tara:strand:+ start:13801 stop:14055 length:255 start_codon:yes stop_codon:yes gene_type:complete
MKKIKRVYLPKWMRYWVIPLFVLIGGLIGYEEFLNEGTKGELGTIGALILFVVFGGAIVMFWLMTEGKLPSYIIEEEVHEKEIE